MVFMDCYLITSYVTMLYFLPQYRNPSCEVHQEPMTFTAIDPSLQDALPQCINTQCNQRTESG